MDDVTFEAWIKELADERNARSDKYLAILKEADDLTTLILKGHLIAEELLTVGIEAYCADLDQLHKANLRFVQRLAMFRALERIPVVPDEFWNALTRLNRLRNELAHRLDDARISTLSAEFVRAVSSSATMTHYKFPKPYHGRDALARAIHFLIGGLEILVSWQHSMQALLIRRLSDEAPPSSKR